LAVVFLTNFAFGQEAVLRPYDRIRITSTGVAALSLDRTLAADGAVRLPGLRPLFLAGRTAREAATLIEREGGGRVGRVGLSLLQPTQSSASFRGVVKQSGSISLRIPKTLRDVVELAEPTDGADMEAVFIQTALGEAMTVNYEATPDFPIRPGDEIVFEFAKVANEILVLGAVKEPGSKPYRHGETLEEAVAAAGGPTGHAVAENIRVLRGGKPLEGANWTEAGRKTILKRGDLVQVPAADNARYVSVIGYVKNQGLVPFKTGMTLMEAIAAAGGTTVGAGLVDVEIRKVFGSQGKAKKYDISSIKKGSPNDPKLAAADIVFVPAFVFKAPVKPRGPHQVVPPR